MENLGKKLDDLDLTSHEVKRLTNALKNEEFRKLLAEYAEEISDPENRKKYEEEIAMMENERGMDIQFIHPEPGYVVKTSDGNVKVFINICKNDKIDKPKCIRKVGPDGKAGHQWSIPHSFAPVRDDNDKNGSKCKVIDFVVNPDTYRMSESNKPFKNMLHDTAVEGIEKQFGIKLDKKNMKFPKMTFKGTPTATVIRSKQDGQAKPKTDQNDLISKMPYPYSDKSTKELSEERELARENEKKANAAKEKREKEYKSKETSDYETPKYSIVHRGYFDIQDFRQAPDAKASTRPKELVVEIDLPLLKSAASADLNVTEKKITLISESPAKYKLDLDLPYQVDEENGTAKFDKSKRRLAITLPVVAATIPSIRYIQDDTASDANESSTPEITERPLIEVLSSEETVTRDGIVGSGDSSDSNDGNEVKEVCSSSVVSKETETPKYFSFPQYDLLQDDETVAVILDVKNGVRDSMVTGFKKPSDQCCYFEVRIMSLGSGGFPMHYKAAVQFPKENLVDEANTYVDVGEHNIVITFIKQDSCLGSWEKAYVGQSSDKLEERVFLSEASVRAQLDALDSEIAERPPFDRDAMPELEVVDMDREQLIVHIKEKRRGGARRTVSESGEEIEVVHEREAPRHLVGILKKRSVSESSSDDVTATSPTVTLNTSRQTSSTSASSPTSESDDAPASSSDESGARSRKKSVSFDEHVERAMFKGNQSVSTMRQALKNKRKKAKKHEKHAAKQRRRRNNSHSSDDHAACNDLDDSALDTSELDAPEADADQAARDEREGEADADQAARDEREGEADTEDALESPEASECSTQRVFPQTDKQSGGAMISAENNEDNPVVNGHSNEQGPKGAIKKNIGESENGENGAKKSKKSNKKKKGSEIADKTQELSPTESDSSPQGEKANKAGGDERTKGEVGEDSDDYTEEQKQGIDEQHAAKLITSISPPSVDGPPKKDPDAPETILSWQDNQSVPDELKPHCAVSLSNSVMFDLDVD